LTCVRGVFNEETSTPPTSISVKATRPPWFGTCDISSSKRLAPTEALIRAVPKGNAGAPKKTFSSTFAPATGAGYQLISLEKQVPESNACPSCGSSKDALLGYAAMGSRTSHRDSARRLLTF